MCASLIRITLTVNRPTKENLHAASSTDSREKITLSSRSHLDHDRSPVADVIRYQVDRRRSAAEQLRARREGGAGIQGLHDSDDRCREELLGTDLRGDSLGVSEGRSDRSHHDEYVGRLAH